MKKVFSTLLIFALFAGALVAQPKISFVKETHDFGNVKRGPDAVYFFEFTNTGNEPLILSKCSGSCSCTKPTCPAYPVMPGAKGKIEVHFETKDKEGAFNKSIFIKTNAANVDKKIGGYEIFIKGVVLLPPKAKAKKK